MVKEYVSERCLLRWYLNDKMIQAMRRIWGQVNKMENMPSAKSLGKKWGWCDLEKKKRSVYSKGEVE